MSILEIDSRNKRVFKTIFVYACISLFCLIFGVVYECFSHEVSSNYMIYFFLFPLAGGVLPFSLMRIFKRITYPGRLSFNLYNSGLATLSAGCCLKGVLDIYGTSSDYILIYLIAGAAFTIAGLIIYGVDKKRKRI